VSLCAAAYPQEGRALSPLVDTWMDGQLAACFTPGPDSGRKREREKERKRERKKERDQAMCGGCKRFRGGSL